MITITKDTIIGDILDIAPHTAPIFLSIGMHCLGCPCFLGETVEEACMVPWWTAKLLALVNERRPTSLSKPNTTEGRIRANRMRPCAGFRR